MSTPAHIIHLYSLLGDGTTFLPIPRGSKGPVVPGWQTISLADSKDPHFQITFKPKPGSTRPRQVPYQGLLRQGNVGVLLGEASAGLCAIDVDCDTWIEPLVALNPWLKDTLQTKGSRGQNFWVRLSDPEEMASFNLSGPDGKTAVEFRGNGRQSVIWGRHPKGHDYAILHEATPVATSLAGIQWPEGLTRGKESSAYTEFAAEAYPIPETPRLKRRRVQTEKMLEHVLWIDNTTAFCKCPGEAEHTNKNGSRDCMVMVDSTPTIYCFHTACADVVRDANRSLRDGIRGNEGLETPGGTVSRDEISDEIFRRLAEQRTLFSRGEAVVEIGTGEAGAAVLQPMNANAIVSRFEQVASFWRTKLDKEGNRKREPAMLTSQMAGELMSCGGVHRILPRIDTIHNCPILVEDGSQLVVATRGYHESRRVYVVDGSAPMDVSVDEAVAALYDLLSEYHFVSDGDRARALAAIVTPALLWANMIQRAPLSAVEADEHQTGKTTMQKIVAAIYNEVASYVVKRTGGVGSLDESMGTALVSGKTFTLLDNLREDVNSQMLEALMTSSGLFPVRIPGKAEIHVDPSKIIFQMTSNGFKMTPDLAARSSIIRIRKRHGHAFRDYGDTKGIEDYVRENHGYFLGCVFAVLRAWHAAGKPTTGTVEHDFRDWAGKLDWISRHVFNAGPLLDGHRAAQKKISSLFVGWFEVTASAFKKSGDWNQWLRASYIGESCIALGIEVPGADRIAGSVSVARIGVATGRCMSHVFPKDGGNYQVVPIEEGYAHCRVIKTKRDDGHGLRESRVYRFSESPEHDLTDLGEEEDAPDASETRVDFK